MRLRTVWIAGAACGISWLGFTVPQPPPRPTGPPVLPLIAVWPAKGGPRAEPTSPEGFLVHLVPESDPDAETVRHCGEWFTLSESPERYAVWVEGNGQISPHLQLLRYPGRVSDSANVRPALLPVGPATTVRPRSGLCSGKGSSIRLLHVDSGFARRVSCEGEATGTAMPPGRIVAAVYDTREHAYAAISRPYDARAGETVDVPVKAPVPPSSDVIVLLRPDAGLTWNAGGVDLTALLSQDAGPAREASVLATRGFVGYAVWYGLTGKRASVETLSTSLCTDSLSLTLHAGAVESAELAVSPRPRLSVAVRLPAGHAREEWGLVVREALSRRVLASQPLGTDEGDVVFRDLPASDFDVVLSGGPWQFSQAGSLKGCRDQALAFDLPVVHISGTVFKGVRGVAATIGFRSSPERWFTVDSDNGGRYAATLLARGLRAVSIRPLDAAAPVLRWLDQGIEDGQTLDFHLPDNTLLVRARSSDAGNPVKGARVSVKHSGQGNRGGGFTVECNAEGEASLPPLERGEVVITAMAKGFRDASARESVGEDTGRKVVDILMKQEGTDRSLRVLLADGSPGAGATVVAGPSPDGLPAWTGTCDGQGNVDVPGEMAGGWVGVAHPGGGLRVQMWPQGDEEAAAIVLDRAAPPLAVLVVDHTNLPLPWARLAVWVAGVRVGAGFLTALTRRPAATDATGVWRVTGLPASSIEILAWPATSASAGLILSGALDHRRVPIAFPWGSAVTIDALE